MKSTENPTQSKKGNGPMKYVLGALAIIGVGAISYMSISPTNADEHEVDEVTLMSKNRFIQVNEYIEMSEFDLKKVKSYMEANNGELPFKPIPNAVVDNEKVSYEEAMAAENKKLGDAPEKEFWY